MSQRKVVVYTGPTISPDVVHAALPEAQVLSPLARGDVLSCQWNVGDTAVVIDGYFRERRSIGHKEILLLLSEGVDVIGAASMGALRAAELWPYGMRGVGVVYRMYATDEINGDDEVGVLHGPAEMGYPPHTVALVNLRYGCREGAATNLIPEATGRRIVEAAKALPFTHRSWLEIRSRLGEEDHDSLSMLKEKIGSGEWDLKRLDALAALRAVGTPDAAVLNARTIEPGALTGISHNWLLARRSLHEHVPGRWISDLDVLDAARLFDDGYPRLHEDVLSGLLEGFADAHGVSVQAYAQAKLGVDGHTPLPERLASWLTPAELAGLTPEQRLRLIMVRVWPIWHSLDWRPAVLAQLRGSNRWHEWSEIAGRAAEAADEARYRLVVPPPTVCGKLFLRHWHQPGTPAPIEMARRGFLSHEDLGRAVARFFAFDVQRGRGAARAATAAGQVVGSR
jgi:hypothetical protein